jgi:hypothetical protein
MRAQRKNVRELTEARCPNEQRAGERKGYGGEFRIIGADGHGVDYIIPCDSDRGRVAKFDKPVLACWGWAGSGSMDYSGSFAVKGVLNR